MLRFFKSTIVMTAIALAAFVVSPTNADACAGLIGSNGAVSLGATTTLAAYHDGVEHYVTAFEFQGGGGQFGTLIPLPGVPSKVERGGAANVEVLQEVRIDALDITILKGGGADVALWAEQHGFNLSPDAPEVLDFYTQRSQIFLAAVFDGDAAKERGQKVGDGTPVHLTIPTDNPWVPLRILGLGKKAGDTVDASVFLLTDSLPTLLPGDRDGLRLDHSAKATKSLLDDLRSDDGMSWIPTSAWLTRINVNTTAGELQYDLAVDASGRGNPSPIAAGLAAQLPKDDEGWFESMHWPVIAAALFGGVGVLIFTRRLDRA